MYKFQLPTTIYHEDNCIKNNNTIFSKCGKKAIIITGRYSAKACGALDDITSVLEEQGISYIIFNEVENNPSIETIERASISAKKFGADFVIGIGGGSPIDAAKAIAVLTANEMTGEELFNNNFENVLPIIAVPTTAGTGTEVTPYSVLINNNKKSKLRLR
jgi:alcohol dehydrogenase class IV